MYGDDGQVRDYCKTCRKVTTLDLAASQWVGIALMARCDTCGDEFVYTESDVKNDMRECRRGY